MKTELRLLGPMAVTFVVVIVLWLLIGFGLPAWLSDTPERGVFGDQFGAANALFSGLALGMVVIAIWLQRRELREAIEQHTKTIQSQVLLSLMDEIRRPEWGAAHRGLAEWKRTHPSDFAETFGRDRTTNGTDAHALEPHRRTFINPFHKLQRLWTAKIIDDTFVKIILTPDAALTLLDIVEPLENSIRCNYDSAIFNMVRVLYPDEAQLESVGAHRQCRLEQTAPPSSP